MALLTEEQSMLKDQAHAWARDEAPVTSFRAMRDSGTSTGYDAKTWQDIAAMGWPGILIPEALGGSGMDYATFGVVLEETGRQLVASPLLASGLVGASALLLGGNEDLKQRWLPGIAACQADETERDGCKKPGRSRSVTPLYHDGSSLSALWAAYGSHDMVADFSGLLTETLRRESRLQDNAGAWQAIQKRLEPENLLARGYRLCPPGEDSHNAFRSCYCRGEDAG